jgi:hypothetical protein
MQIVGGGSSTEEREEGATSPKPLSTCRWIVAPCSTQSRQLLLGNSPDAPAQLAPHVFMPLSTPCAVPNLKISPPVVLITCREWHTRSDMHKGTIPKVSSDRVCSSCRCAEYIFGGSQTVGIADGGEVGRHLVNDSSCCNKHTTKSLEQLLWRCGIKIFLERTCA